MLVWVGTAMAAFPIFYAVIENDLRRVLAYSVNNQLGFMVVGIGIGTELAVNGAVAHAFADILFKMLLFMSMGAVLLRAGTVNGSELGGLYKSMPWTTGFCIVGAASISAFPLFSGFVTKSMIMSAAAGEGYVVTWLVLLFASAGVFHHAGIKIPYFAFFAHDSGIRCREAPAHMLIAMALAAALCIGIGSLPAALYSILPHPVAYVPYTATHVLDQLQLLVFSALAFAVLMRTGIYPPELRAINLDSDWVYRRLARGLARSAASAVARVLAACSVGAHAVAEWALRALLRQDGPYASLVGPRPTASMAIWVMLMLAGYLLLYYA
jgi:multicomponent Na+:H+ antiporter subunit D